MNYLAFTWLVLRSRRSSLYLLFQGSSVVSSVREKGLLLRGGFCSVESFIYFILGFNLVQNELWHFGGIKVGTIINCCGVNCQKVINAGSCLLWLCGQWPTQSCIVHCDANSGGKAWGTSVSVQGCWDRNVCAAVVLYTHRKLASLKSSAPDFWTFWMVSQQELTPQNVWELRCLSGVSLVSHVPFVCVQWHNWTFWT